MYNPCLSRHQLMCAFFLKYTFVPSGFHFTKVERFFFFSLPGEVFFCVFFDNSIFD